MTREIRQSVSRKSREGHRSRHVRKRFLVATWNVCSLVENSGDRRVCRKRQHRRNSTIDRKIDLLGKELNR